MKGLFIPEITVEMFRNGCLEAIEQLMTEGEIYDIEYNPEKEGDWHPFRQEKDPETGLWKFVDPPEDGQHILITVNMPGHEPVQEDHWYEDVYCYLDSGYTPCAEAIAWKEWPDPYVPDINVVGKMEVKK